MLVCDKVTNLYPYVDRGTAAVTDRVLFNLAVCLMMSLIAASVDVKVLEQAPVCSALSFRNQRLPVYLTPLSITCHSPYLDKHHLVDYTVTHQVDTS